MMLPNGQWTPWQSPNDIDLALLSNVYGVYQVGSVALDDTLPDDEISDRVIYIGEAKRQDERFKKLVRSWSGSLANDPHSSYATWLASAQHQADYPINSIRIRFKNLSAESSVSEGRLKFRHKDRARSSTDELVDNLGSSLRPETDYPYYEESRLIDAYKECFGERPPLNRVGGDKRLSVDSDFLSKVHPGVDWEK